MDRTLNDRIVLLERRNMILQSVVGTLVLAIGFFSLIGQVNPDPGVIVAREIHLVDAKGNVRIAMIAAEDVKIGLADATGKTRASIVADDEGASLNFYHPSISEIAMLGIGGAGPMLTFKRRGDDPDSVLMHLGAGEGSKLLLTSRDGQRRASLSASAEDCRVDMRAGTNMAVLGIRDMPLLALDGADCKSAVTPDHVIIRCDDKPVWSVP